MLNMSGIGRPAVVGGGIHGMGAENGNAYFDMQRPGFAQHPASDPDTRFFIIRSSTDYNVEVSMQRGIWATIPRNEARLGQAVQEAKHVILFFRVQSSQCWSGYALMRNAPGQGSCPSSVFAGRSGRPFVGQTFDVEWIRKVPLSVEKTRHLLNRFNNGESVNRAMDGQPVDPEAGRALAYLFDEMALPRGAAPYSPSYGVSMGPIGPPQGISLPVQAPSHTQQQPGRQRTTQQQQRQRQQDMASQRHGQQQAVQVQGPQRNKHAARRQLNAQDGSSTSHVGGEALETKAPNNPAMRIFPIDLTAMTYDDYIETYEASQALWQRVFKKHGYTVEEGQDQMPQEKAAEDHVGETDMPQLQVETAAHGGHSEVQQPSRDESDHSANPSDAAIMGVNKLALQEPATERGDSVPTETEQQAFALLVKEELET